MDNKIYERHSMTPRERALVDNALAQEEKNVAMIGYLYMMSGLEFPNEGELGEDYDER